MVDYIKLKAQDPMAYEKPGPRGPTRAEVLCPKLSSDHVVIMDNARLHKTPHTRELIEAVGAELIFLPLIHPIIIPLNMIWFPISNENANITQKSPLRTLFRCISNSKIYHSYGTR